MEFCKAEPKGNRRTAGDPFEWVIVRESSPRCGVLLMTAPVPWSLAWSDNGELAPQDQLDLLQSLVTCESASVQHGLIMAVEQLTVQRYSLLASVDVTSVWS
jgi:hypothetical protein